MSARVALLEYFFLFGFGNDLFFHGFGGLCVFLDPSEQFSSLDVAAGVSIEADGFDEFEVVPVDVAFLDGLGLLFFAPRLLLLGVVVLEHAPAAVQNLLSAAEVAF